MIRQMVIAALSVALLGLSACGDDLNGEVVDKDVRPGYDYMYMQPVYSTRCTGTGTSQVCSQYVSTYIPIWYHVPDCWKIKVKGQKSGETCISKSKWDSTEVGDTYVGADVDPKDRQEKKQ